MPLIITIQVEGKTSHPATFKEFVEALQDTLSKVQVTSPYCKECGAKKKRTLFVNHSISQQNSVVCSYQSKLEGPTCWCALKGKHSCGRL